MKRGYKEEQISKEINRAAVKDRNELMTYKERKKNNRTPLVVTFNRRLPKLKDLVEESWNILGINETIGQKFTEKPLICYRRNPNLRDILGQNRISGNRVVIRKTGSTGGCSPCRARPDTKCCNHDVQTKFFTDKLKRNRYEIR